LGGSEQNFEEGVVGLEFAEFVVVLGGALLELEFGVGLREGEADEALSGGGVELLGGVDEDDVLLLGVDEPLDEDADVD
jgi:hypothetical protein